MITPHIAGSLGTETQRMTAQALDELQRYVEGTPPRYARGLGGERMSSAPANPEISPYTGWIRADFAALADRMLLAARRYASPSQALITPPGAPGGYGSAIDGLEGFARTFLLARFRVAGEQGSDPLNVLERYAQGSPPAPIPPRRSAG